MEVKTTVQEIRNEQMLAAIIAQRDAQLLASNEQIGQLTEDNAKLRAGLEKVNKEMEEIKEKIKEAKVKIKEQNKEG